MAENRCGCGSQSSVGPREMICIETNRILDSCRDRDCFEHVRVKLTDYGRDILDRSGNIRVKDACIAWTYITIDPVQFNRGFYQVLIRFYVKLTFEACVGTGRAQEFEGVAVVEKKVILWGSESNVSIFKSSGDGSDFCAAPELCCPTRNVPTAVVEVVDPIVLGHKVVEEGKDCCAPCACNCCCACDIPECVQARFGGSIVDDHDGDKYLVVSLGFFSVVRIVRPGQYLVQASEYNVPDKTCVVAEEDDPCSIFRTMAFPTAEFNPPSYGTASGGDHKCGCN
ncbi:MAG: hypothetical protein IKD37_07920 [Clostridia bacterium]|nr:hypothetical protein [Clostridia bacterium]